MQLEWFPKSIRSFQAFSYRFAPFVSLGVHWTSSNPQASSTYNIPNGISPEDHVLNPNNLYSFWYSDPRFLPNPNMPIGEREYPIKTDNISAWSLVTSVGVRYKLTPLSDLMLDLRWQYYFSDWIDGFNHQLGSNKFNDWLIWLNFGYIYYLD